MEEIALGDLVQLACLEGSDRVLKVSGETVEGEIYFSNGEIVHAVSSRNEGEKAFFEIMRMSRGTFFFSKGRPPKTTISVPWNFLLIEASRQIDEGDEKNEKGLEKKPTVLIVDDSRVACKSLRECIKEKFNIENILEASNGRQAIDAMEKEKPGLVTLDMNMPIMAGDVTLKHIMIRSPAPVVLISGIDPQNFPRIMDFLRLGAVDFIPKPLGDMEWDNGAERLGRHIEKASSLMVQNIRRAKLAKPVDSKITPSGHAKRIAIFVGGAGGLLELQKIVPALSPDEHLCIVIFQDMADEIVSPVSQYLDKFFSGNVSPLRDEAELLSGLCLISNWGKNWDIRGDKPGRLSLYPAEDHGLDLEQFLGSVAKNFGPSSALFVLSGADLELEKGVEKMSAMGGRILLQDPETCLDPNPVLRLQRIEMEDGTFEPEKIIESFNAWLEATDTILADS